MVAFGTAKTQDSTRDDAYPKRVRRARARARLPAITFAAGAVLLAGGCGIPDSLDVLDLRAAIAPESAKSDANRSRADAANADADARQPSKASSPKPDSAQARTRVAYPACARVRRPGMITFRQSVDPARMATVAAVGDVLLHDSVQRYAASKPDGFYALMAPVADLIRAADVSFANLEGPAAANVSKSGRVLRAPPRRYDGVVYTGYPMFNYHPSVAADLRRAGFDVLLTANNHALDRFAIGADRTIEAVEQAGLRSTGTKHRDAMDRPWHTTTPVAIGGQSYTVAWLGCTYDTNGIPDRAKQVLHCYKQRKVVLETVSALAARDDIQAVILAPHWGTEYRAKPNKRQRELAREAIDAGAAAVIGTHPHVVQPIEKHVAPDGREGLIAYSLGNFVSNQFTVPRRSSAILLLGLTPDKNEARRGKLAPAAVGWIPIWMRNRAGVTQAEAIDRAGDAALPNLRHLLKTLPEANRMPADTSFWAARACTLIAGQ